MHNSFKFTHAQWVFIRNGNTEKDQQWIRHNSDTIFNTISAWKFIFELIHSNKWLNGNFVGWSGCVCVCIFNIHCHKNTHMKFSNRQKIVFKVFSWIGKSEDDDMCKVGRFSFHSIWYFRFVDVKCQSASLCRFVHRNRIDNVRVLLVNLNASPDSVDTTQNDSFCWKQIRYNFLVKLKWNNYSFALCFSSHNFLNAFASTTRNENQIQMNEKFNWTRATLQGRCGIDRDEHKMR